MRILHLRSRSLRPHETWHVMSALRLRAATPFLRNGSPELPSPSAPMTRLHGFARRVHGSKEKRNDATEALTASRSSHVEGRRRALRNHPPKKRGQAGFPFSLAFSSADSSHFSRSFWRSRHAFERSACVSARGPLQGLPGPLRLDFANVVMRRFSPDEGKLPQEDAGMLQAVSDNLRLSWTLEPIASDWKLQKEGRLWRSLALSHGQCHEETLSAHRCRGYTEP